MSKQVKQKSYKKLQVFYGFPLLLFFLLLLPLTYHSLYKPMKVHLEEEIIENFKFLADSYHQNFCQYINRKRESAESISSRSMMRLKTVEFFNDNISLEELTEYIQPKFIDGIKALTDVKDAWRISKGHVVAYYKTDIKPEAFPDFEPDNLLWIETRSYFEIEKSHLFVYSPILAEKQVAAYDLILFDIKGILNELQSHHEKVALERRDDFNLSSEESCEYVDLIRQNGMITYQHYIEVIKSVMSISIAEDKLLKPVTGLVRHHFRTYFFGFILTFILAIVILMFQAVRLLKHEENMRLKADAANRAKGSFLANMGHELRTPINGILGFVQLMEMDGVNSEHEDYLKRMRQSSENLLSIINSILEVSKLESGITELNVEVINLHEALDSAVAPLKNLAEMKSLNFIFNGSQDIPAFVETDRVKIVQIVTNLIGNALKFTDEGEIKVEFSLIDVNYSDSVNLNIMVQDTGIGMSPETIENIYKPFYQGDSSDTKRYGGSGLGLKITRELVEMMKGKISVKSTLGQGSIFTAEIPVKLVEEL